MSADTNVHRQPPARHRLRLVVALLAVAVAAVVLSACGGSSGSGSGTTNSANAGTTNGTGATKPGAPGASRFGALRSCLQKAGVNLPSGPTGGAGRPGSGGPPSGGAGGFKLPAGVSRSKFQEAIKKCGGGGRFPGGARPGLGGSAARATLTKYAECMRENGVKLPKPNTNGKGPVFDTKGIDTTSAAFKNAQKKCQSDLKGAFGGGRPPAGGGAPPAGGEGGPPPGGSGPPPGSEAQGG